MWTDAPNPRYGEPARRPPVVARQDARTPWQSARLPLGVVLGALTGPVELVYVTLAGVALLPGLVSARVRRHGARWIGAASATLATLERRRLDTFFGTDESTVYDNRRAFAYLAIRWLVGLLGACVLSLLLVGLWGVAAMAWSWLAGGRLWPLESAGSSGGAVVTQDVFLLAVPGLVLLFLNIAGIAGVAVLDRRLAQRLLGPSRQELLGQRITQLATTRANVVDAVTDERRRIERDLHDGVQQRLVALGMLLGRARREGAGESIAELLEQAHEESRHALDDLREVAWRVYPAALDNGGLHAALESVAERAALPVHIDNSLSAGTTARVDAVAYFVVSEAVTNAAKHSGASLVTVHVCEEEAVLRVLVDDDGVGGADPGGAGLSGLARRVAALDGTFRVDSPDGGPTTVAAELPCV